MAEPDRARQAMPIQKRFLMVANFWNFPTIAVLRILFCRVNTNSLVGFPGDIVSVFSWEALENHSLAVRSRRPQGWRKLLGATVVLVILTEPFSFSGPEQVRGIS
jgi:nicotinamide riboside transporter PnuC